MPGRELGDGVYVVSEGAKPDRRPAGAEPRLLLGRDLGDTTECRALPHYLHAAVSELWHLLLDGSRMDVVGMVLISVCVQRMGAAQ